jgi:hypothetical protein
MIEPSIDIDTTDKLVDGDMTLRLTVDDHSISGAVGPWDVKNDDFEFGLSCDIRIGSDWTGQSIKATVQVGGIQSHGSDIAWKRIDGYTVATRLIEVAERMPYDTYNDVADAVVDSVWDLNIRGLRVLDYRNVIVARKELEATL